jgi:hypothetical protein
MTALLQDIAAELVDDGDECEVGAWTLRLTVEPDEYASIMDEQGEGVWCGQLAWAETARYSDHYTRPDWADGGAELLRPHWSRDAIWWRPLDDCLRDRELRDRVRSTILDLMEFGYSVVTVEAFRHRDIYGRGCVEAVASLGMVDECDLGIVHDLVAEVLAQISGVE